MITPSFEDPLLKTRPTDASRAAVTDSRTGFSFDMFVEISCGGEPIKYELNKRTGGLVVDRFLQTAMRYPCNYGYIPGTLSLDGDPSDVLVITPAPVMSGAVLRVRPVGVLFMQDEAGPDEKILAVPLTRLTRDYDGIVSIEDLPRSERARIEHFFKHYKDLEPNKWVKIEGWGSVDNAWELISDAQIRYGLNEESAS